MHHVHILDLLVRCLEKVTHIFSQMVVSLLVIYYGRIRKKSPSTNPSYLLIYHKNQHNVDKYCKWILWVTKCKGQKGVFFGEVGCSDPAIRAHVLHHYFVIPTSYWYHQLRFECSVLGKSSKQNFSQMVVSFIGDEIHGRMGKKSPSQQTQAD